MIDRYFDAMDLNNTEIYIEWETPKGKNNGPIKSVSETYLKMIDDENYPGKLIFGWAISDAITKESGTLKFAVRFVQWNDEGKLVYSYNTLTAQVAIHPSLGLNLELLDKNNFDNSNDRLLERIEPSVVVGGVQAAIPYFLTNLEILDEGYDIQPNHTTGTYDLSVVATADDTGMVTYTWKRSEIGEDAWVEITDENLNRTEFIELTSEEYQNFGWKLPENRIYYIEREDDSAYLLSKSYYDLTDANTKAYFQQSQGIDINSGEFPKLYEKRAVLTVEKYGDYRAEARNRIFNSLTKNYSKVVTFKTPDAVEFDETKQTPDKHIIGESSALLAPKVVDATGDLIYTWYKAPEGIIASKDYKITGLPHGSEVSYGVDGIRVFVPKEAEFTSQNVGAGGDENSYYMNMICYIPEGAESFREGDLGELEPEKLKVSERTLGEDEHGKYRMRWLPIASKATGNWVYHGAKSFTPAKEGAYIGWNYVVEWYDKDGDIIKTDSLRIDLSNEGCNNKLGEFVEVDIDEIVNESVPEGGLYVTEPGIYKVNVTRVRNRAETNKDSMEYRVTEAPAVPVFDDDVYTSQSYIPVKDLLSGETVLEVKWNSDIRSDEFYVSWNLYRGDQEQPKEDLEVVVYKLENKYSSTFNPMDLKYTQAFEEAGEANREGLYYAVVKNRLNGVDSAYNEKPAINKMFLVTGS